MTKVVPSLTEQAWVSDGNRILNHLLSYYILTDAGQSIAFNNNLISLPFTYFRFINDPDGMSVGVRSDIENLLGKYFESVEVETEVRDLSEGKYGILLSATVTDKNNKRFHLSKVSEMSTEGLRRVIDINNLGEGYRVLNSL